MSKSWAFRYFHLWKRSSNRIFYRWGIPLINFKKEKEIELNNLIQLTKDQIEPACRVLTRAFHDDPLFGLHFYPNESKRKKKLPFTMNIFLKYGLRYGEVYATSSNVEGVAIWVKSPNDHMTMWRSFRCGGLSYYVKVRGKAIKIQMSADEFITSIRKRVAPSNYWNLKLIGVEPSYQGKGFGGILLKAMLKQIDRESLPCYLETENEKNISFYQRYGFKVRDESQIPDSKVINWALLREKPC